MAQEAFIGEIRHFGFGFAPKGWAQCNGQTLPINQNQVLFSIIGTAFGGDGQTTFKLPNLQGTAVISAGMPPGGPTYTYGEVGGQASVPLTINQIPAHIHQAQGSGASVSNGTPGPTTLPGLFGSNVEFANSVSSQAAMGGRTIGNNGAGQGHENRQPYMVLNVCICLVGIYPVRS